MNIPGFKKLRARKSPRKIVNTLGFQIPKADWRHLKTCKLTRRWDPNPMRTSRFLVEDAPSGRIYFLAQNWLQGGYSLYNPYRNSRPT